MINQDRLKELLTYDSENGLFSWNVTRGKSRKGNVAGHKNKIGYIEIGLDNKLYLAHRLVFVYLHGCCNGNVDHIDGNPGNNKVGNLRLADPQTNARNASKPKSNKSGRVGVSFDAVNGKWRATIKANRKQIHLGRFHSIDDAILARAKAESYYGFHENHGR